MNAFEQTIESDIEEKPKETLQAQIESFADVEKSGFSIDQETLLRHASELSKVKDLDNLPDDLPEELRSLIAENKDAYVSFLRKNRPELTQIAESIKLYNEKFKSIVQELIERIHDNSPEEMPEYLGSGSNGTAYKIEVNGSEYAVKIPKAEKAKARNANFDIKPMKQAAGVRNAAQFVCHSFEDSAVIMDLLQGETIEDVFSGDVSKCPDKHLKQLIDTVLNLDQKDLVLDYNSSNFLYSDEAGFLVLDYHLENHESKYGIAQKLMAVRLPLVYREGETLHPNDSEWAEKRKLKSIEFYKRLLPLTIRLASIIQQNNPEIFDQWKKAFEEGIDNPEANYDNIVNMNRVPDDVELNEYIVELKTLFS